MKFGSAEHKAANLKFWEAMTALDSEAVQGLHGTDSRVVPGRLLKFGVADGYAYYIILKANKKTCKLVHLPYADGYHFQGVTGGCEVFRDVVEDNLAWADVLVEAFKKVKTWTLMEHRMKLIEHGMVDMLPLFPVVDVEID